MSVIPSLSTIFACLSGKSLLLAGSGLDQWQEAQFSWWDTLRYYYYFLQNEFAEYAAVVRVSYFITVLSTLSIGIVFLVMLRSFLKRQRHDRYYKKIYKKYGPSIARILSSPQDLTTTEVKEIMGIKKYKAGRRWRNHQWWKLLASKLNERILQTESSIDDTKQCYANLHRLLNALGISGFIDDLLREGFNYDRVFLVQTAQEFRLPLSESSLLRMSRSKDPSLRRVVQTYYMWLSDEDPFRFLEEGGDKFLPQDGIWFHALMALRKRMDKPLPSIVPFINSAVDPKLKALLIRETGYWGSEKDLQHLITYFSDDDDQVRRASFEAVGRGKLRQAVPELIKVYDRQSESLKRTILRSLFSSGLTEAIPFFGRAATGAVSTHTLRVALRCLWHSSDAGKAQYYKVKQADVNDHEVMYRQIESEGPERKPVISPRDVQLTNEFIEAA